MQLLRPVDLPEALQLLALPDHCALAGGTALQLQWFQGRPKPATLVDLTGLVPQGIEEGAETRIGAATPLAEIEAAALPLLSQAVRDVAAPNIRRLATLGGTIGFGAGCLLPALLVLGASVQTSEGTRTLADYLQAPRGVILWISYPTPAVDAQFIWRKTGLRAAFTPALLVCAGLKQAGRLRLAVGGGIVTPRLIDSHDLDALADPKAVEALLLPRLDLPSCAVRSGTYRRKLAARVLAWGLWGRPDAAPLTAQPRPAPTDARLPALGSAHMADRWHPRPDIEPKVHGHWPYLTDVRHEDMLVGRILRAAHPHATILKIDTRRAEALEGVRAVVTAKDVPGLNGFGIIFQDQPVLCADKVRYLGDAVAAVAAIDAETADRALALIEVHYAPLAPVTDPEAALTGGALVHDGGNLVCEVGREVGDLAAAFAKAAHVVEETYHTPRQMHGFMETEGGYVLPQPDGQLLVAVGGQHGARDREQLARILALPEDHIRVITSPIGGGFGGKDELTVQGPMALLALKAKAPVRLMLSRAESLRAGTKRNPMRIRLRTACDAEGRLLAQEVDVVADCGAYASLSPGVLETAMEHAAGPYVIPAIRTRGRLAYTNNGTCGAFRGFGANQMTYAIEAQMDRLAALTGLDPIDIRRRNLRAPGDLGYLGQEVAGSERLVEMLDLAAASPLWTPAQIKGDWIEGTGMGLMWQGNGLGSVLPDFANGTLRLAPDGQIEILCGMDEMGQGLHAGLVASVADRLGCARTDVRPITGDTGRAPDAGSTSASRGGYVIWQTVQRLAPPFIAQLLREAGRLLTLPPEDLRIVPKGIALVQGNGDLRLSFADLARRLAVLPEESTHFDFPKTSYTDSNARFLFASASCVARVAIHRLSGEVKLLATEMHTAAGPVMDVASYLGQMEGALVQGLGFTLSEDVLMRDGHYLTTNFDSYAMPNVRDVPRDMRITAMESLDAGDPYGPRGAGELGIGALTPAMINAIGDAIGYWPNITPINPEVLLERLS